MNTTIKYTRKALIYFFRGETCIYENLDDIKADAIHLALKYLTLSKNDYLEYYWQIYKK